ncbi:MAG: DUF3185 family protein [Alphaproteobacteria bacterium]
MQPARLIGFVLLAVGAILLAFGFNAADAPADQISEALTGQYTDRTMWYLIGGGAAVVAGGLLAFFGPKRA